MHLSLSVTIYDNLAMCELTRLRPPAQQHHQAQHQQQQPSSPLPLPYLMLQSPEQLIQTLHSEADARHFVLMRTLLMHYDEAQRCIPPAIYAARLASLDGLPPRYSQEIYRVIAFAHARGYISSAEMNNLIARLAAESGGSATSHQHQQQPVVEELMQFGRLLEFCRTISLFLANDDRAGAIRFCEVLGLNVTLQ
jgi:hypothetical protein